MSKIWKRLEAFPPVACRLLARHRYGAPLTNREIAAESGLTVLRVEAMSEQTTWRGIDIHDMQAFTNACGLDFFKSHGTNKAEAYMKKAPKWTYLKRSDLWEDYYKKLFRIWIAYERSRTKY